MQRNHFARRFRLGLLALVAMLSVPLYSQVAVSGRITGFVSDSSGAGIVGATVNVNSPALMAQRQAKTQGDGSFLFDQLPIGTYEVKVEMPGLPTFGAGWIGVQARHGDRLGEYPILMPMTTEQSLIGGREINGEPKKLAEVEVTRDGAHVSAHIARMGSVICEITGTVTGTRDNYEMEKTDFWLKLSPSCEEAGVLDQDPLLVYGEKTERTRLHESIEGELILKEAPLDPIADLVVRRMVDLNWTERASTQVGRVIGPVPRAGVEPFIHQRYDDISVLGAAKR